MFDIKFNEYRTELTKADIPHIHLYVECNKYIKLRDLQQFVPFDKFGAINVQKARNTDNVLDYITKEDNLLPANAS